MHVFRIEAAHEGHINGNAQAKLTKGAEEGRRRHFICRVDRCRWIGFCPPLHRIAENLTLEVNAVLVFCIRFDSVSCDGFHVASVPAIAGHHVPADVVKQNAAVTMAYQMVDCHPAKSDIV